MSESSDWEVSGTAAKKLRKQQRQQQEKEPEPEVKYVPKDTNEKRRSEPRPTPVAAAEQPKAAVPKQALTPVTTPVKTAPQPVPSLATNLAPKQGVNGTTATSPGRVSPQLTPNGTTIQPVVSSQQVRLVYCIVYPWISLLFAAQSDATDSARDIAADIANQARAATRAGLHTVPVQQRLFLEFIAGQSVAVELRAATTNQQRAAAQSGRATESALSTRLRGEFPAPRWWCTASLPEREENSRPGPEHELVEHPQLGQSTAADLVAQRQCGVEQRQQFYQHAWDWIFVVQ